jgi:hypothetical protein
MTTNYDTLRYTEGGLALFSKHSYAIKYIVQSFVESLIIFSNFHLQYQVNINNINYYNVKIVSVLLMKSTTNENLFDLY